jgi:hypothetical protein
MMSLSVISSLSAPRGRPVSAGGQIDADGDLAGRPVGAAPFGQLMRRGFHHVGAELDQEPHLVAERQEVVGGEHAAAGVAPARQRFEPGDGAGV